MNLGTMRRISPQDACRHASESIRKALQLDAALGEAHASLAYLNWQYEWNWSNAEHEFRRALELNPNYLDGHEAFAWFLSWSGRREEALREFTIMHQIDPAFPMRFNDQAGLFYHLRQYHDSVENGREAVRLNPGDWSSHYFLGTGYLGLRRIAEAVSEFQKAVALSQGDSDAVASLASANAAEGKRAEVKKILEDLQRQSRTQYISPYMIAAVWVALDDKDKAFTYLERAYQEKSPDVAYFLKSDLRLDPIRNDPRFADVLRRVNFPH